MPAAISDGVAEAALACCKVVLEKGRLAHAAQFLEVLERFAAIVPLDRTAVTEEVGSAFMHACLHMHVWHQGACAHVWCCENVSHHGQPEGSWK